MAAAARAAADAGLAGLVITPGYDLRYLIGSRAQTFERLTALVLPAAGDPTIVVPRLELASLKESAVPELGVAVRDWVDGDDPYRLVAEALLGDGPFAVAVTDSMPALHLLPLADVARGGAGAGHRCAAHAADDQGRRRGRRAAQGGRGDRPGARPGAGVPGAGTHRSRRGRRHRRSHCRRGHSEVAFIIVGSGPHGADPHHECSDRELVKPVTSWSSISVARTTRATTPTRPAPTASASPIQRSPRRYAVLQRAQRAAVDAVRPGVTAEQVDAAARDVLAEEGLAEAFVHRTGHGIGLSVHEEPYIVAGNALPLQEGMAFSVEPGIYFPGQWGARIEDIVIVTADGALSVNNRPHDLVVVPVA